ncbi:DUF5655 domain-containing protein [Methanosphaera sp. BMS]|uniref:DUF5655 domain-containing protein n=1 Tax=Methanosphaera sp. BMS TaxID=1789762 RepID=UPI000DC1D551|nr:DUF5655 domain-containing protein [Methanosphaera sp. BMS]AWX31852.1 hypothetical protein AW729_01540 [Methanosphaera sp. BMS]
MVYCKICSKITVNDNELCKVCQNKRKAANIIINLQDNVNFKKYITKTKLYNIGYTDVIRLEDLVWTLNETNVIKKINNEEYEWIDLDLLKKFVEKYDEKNGQDFKITEIVSDENQDNCMYCGKSIPKSSKKKKICKICKKTRKTLKNIKFIDSFEYTLNIDDMIQETSKEEYQIEGIIFDLIENDLIKKIDEKNYQKIPENIEQYLKEHEDINNKINQSKKQKVDKKISKTKISDDTTKEKVDIGTNSTNETNEIKSTIENKTPKNESKPLFIVNTDNPHISYIEPAGWVSYKTINRNTLNISEYNELIEIPQSPEYYPSKVYILKDFENLKWIKELNKYYIYTKGYKDYQNVKIYTSSDIEEELKTSQIKETKKTETHDKVNNISEQENNIPNNNAIFDEFFNKHITISEDEKSWITYDELFNIFTKYVCEEYQIKIPELGDNGFNVLIYSKIKKTNGIKTKNVNSIIEFNLIYDDAKLNKKQSKDTIEKTEFEDMKVDKENKEQINNKKLSFSQITEVNKLLTDFLNENIKILPKNANTNDLTQKDIYESFEKYLKTKNSVIDYSVFSYSFQNIVANTSGINRLIDEDNIYYNFEYKEHLMNLDQSENISKKQVTKDTTSKVESIKGNLEIFDEFFEKHLKFTNNGNWIKKQRLYTLFNNYALNNYNVEIPETGLDGFNSILRTKKKTIKNLEERIRNGKIEYNLKYNPQKEKTEDKKTQDKLTIEDEIVDIEFKRLEEYFEKYIQILDKKVDKKDITKKQLYMSYNNYYKEEYGEEISYADFTSSFIKLLSKHSDIYSVVVGSIVHYNVDIKDTSEEVKDNNVDENINETTAQNKPNKEIFEEFWNKHILVIEDMDDGITTSELYDYYKEYSKNNYNIGIKQYGVRGFQSLLSKKIKESSNEVFSRVIKGKLKYNLKYVLNKNDIEIEDKNIKDETKKEKVTEKLDIIPVNIKEYFKNKTTKEIETTDELIIVYNDIVHVNEYLSLIKLFTNTKDYLNKINISWITDDEMNVNIEYIIKKEKMGINHSLVANKVIHENNMDTGKEKTEYNPKTKKTVKKFTLEDHENLKPENPSYNLFNILNENILNIDKGVSRAILKKFVGYKKNNKRFADIIIRKSSLTLSLYIPIKEIVDPRGICIDITNKGSWTNGLIDVKIYDVAEIGYAMNLIIQSYEYTQNNYQRSE